MFCFGCNKGSQDKVFEAKVKIGFMRDREVILEEGMTLLKKGNFVYHPNSEYYSSDPLPSDWIGLITGKTFNHFEEENDQSFNRTILTKDSK